MKLLRVGAKGAEKPAMVDGQGCIRDLSGHIDDIAGDALRPESLDRLRKLDPASLPLVQEGARLGPCVGCTPNFVCIGLNYTDHAEEAGLPIPTEPVIFNKHGTSASGPNDPIIIPGEGSKLDWEVELAIVIGKPAWHVKPEEALSHVAGYCLFNDVSERAWQMERGGQWSKGKSYPSFAPMGPWLVTADEIPDPQALDLWLDVNGQRMQTGSTSRMIFSVAEIVSYLSQFMLLQAGDVIPTGTPPGVGLGMKPPRYLKAGEVVTLGATGLGHQRQVVIERSDALQRELTS